jgi:hypothetical protein
VCIASSDEVDCTEWLSRQVTSCIVQVGMASIEELGHASSVLRQGASWCERRNNLHICTTNDTEDTSQNINFLQNLLLY